MLYSNGHRLDVHANGCGDLTLVAGGHTIRIERADREEFVAAILACATPVPVRPDVTATGGSEPIWTAGTMGTPGIGWVYTR